MAGKVKPKKVKCALTGEEFDAVTVARCVVLDLDADTKVEVRVMKRAGSSEFVQSPVTPEAAEALRKNIEALLQEGGE